MLVSRTTTLIVGRVASRALAARTTRAPCLSFSTKPQTMDGGFDIDSFDHRAFLRQRALQQQQQHSPRMERELDIDFYDHRAEFMPPRQPQPARNVLDTSLEQGIRGARTNFAIDAPDGEPDGHWEEELEDMKHWLAGQDRPIDDVKADELLRLAVDGPYAFAVDAPDGEVDAHVTEDIAT